MSLLDADAPSDPAARLDLVLANIARQIVDHEAALRGALRMSLDDKVPRDSLVLRQGRAVRWIEDALSPLRPELGKAGLHRLVLAIRAAIGIEPLSG